MKTIGVIGGQGPHATMDFEQKIHAAAQRLVLQKENAGYPPMIVVYLPHAPYRFSGNSQATFSLLADRDLLETASFLGKLCDFIVMTSNTHHFFIEDIENASGKNVISLVSLTLQEILKRKVKKVGILAMRTTVKYRLYQEILEKNGIEWQTIPDSLSLDVDKALLSVMEGKISKRSKRYVVKAIRYLRISGCENIILGSSELPFLLSAGRNSDLIDPLQLLAEHAVVAAIKRE